MNFGIFKAAKMDIETSKATILSLCGSARISLVIRKKNATGNESIKKRKREKGYLAKKIVFR